jgi:hypothetical protein
MKNKKGMLKIPEGILHTEPWRVRYFPHTRENLLTFNNTIVEISGYSKEELFGLKGFRIRGLQPIWIPTEWFIPLSEIKKEPCSCNWPSCRNKIKAGLDENRSKSHYQKT